MMFFLRSLLPSWVWVLIGLFTLSAAIAAPILIVMKRRKAAAKKADPTVDIRGTFATAVKLLGEKVTDAKAREAMPCVLVLGGPGTGKTAVLDALGAAFGKPPADPNARARALDRNKLPPACDVRFSEHAVFVEIAGRLLTVNPADDKVAAADAELALKTIYAAMKRHRSDRPVDAIVLAISAAELVPAAKARPEDIETVAGLLKKKIAEAQKALEMNVPIYLVVTQCDAVDGFKAFGAEVPSSMRHAVLGWSSPFAPTTRVTPDWVDEALGSVRRSLSHVETRRFSGEAPVAAAEDYFIFPSELGTVGDALRSYVDEIFLPGPQDGPMLLRGIYFCGDAAQPPAPPALPVNVGGAAAPPPTLVDPNAPPAPPAAPAHAILFVKDLFERKIFPEAVLAKPNDLAVKRRKRWILALQVLSIVVAFVFGLLLSFKSGSLARDTTSMLPYLSDLSSDLPTIGVEIQAHTPDPGGDQATARSVALLKDLEEFHSNGLQTWLIPGSWFSGLDNAIQDAVGTGYKYVVFEAFRARLTAKATTLVNRDGIPAGTTVVIPAPTLEKSPEFARLDEWLRDLMMYEANVKRFRSVVTRNEGEATDASTDLRLHGVADLSTYLFGHAPDPQKFFTGAYHYRGALDGHVVAPPFDAAPYRDDANTKADLLFANVFARMLLVYNDDVIRQDLDALTNGFEQLGKGEADYKVTDLARLSAAVKKTQEHLAVPSLAWISGTALPAIPELVRLLDAVRSLDLTLGGDVQSRLKGLADSKLLALQTDLKNASTQPTGALLLQKEGGIVQPQLSTFVAGLIPPLDGLLGQSFMADSDVQSLPDDLADARIGWDADVLKDAAKLGKDYETFVTGGGLKGFPKGVLETVTALAERTLKARTLAGIARAAHREVAAAGSDARLIDTVRVDVGSLAGASSGLKEILGSFGRLRFDDARDKVRALVKAQGSRLLTQADRVLAGEQLYEVRGGNFAWWVGEGVPGFGAFNVTDAAGLAEYAVSQRGRADTLAKELAEPVLALLGSAEVGADPTSVAGMIGWTNVVVPLRDYENKKAGNGVTALEQFLQVDLPKITFENCMSELDKSAPRTNGRDFFTDRRDHIRRLLADRCAILSENDADLKYSELRREFNRSLADRFPFAKLDPTIVREDASPEAVRAFLVKSTEFRTRYRGVLLHRADTDAGQVLRFVDQMEAVRAFLQPMWAQVESAHDGVFDVKVEFRANKQREVGGNQIAGWTLKMAEDRLVSGGPKNTSHWRVGDPVRIDLRWAKDGLDVPSPIQGAAGAIVRERLVSFEDGGVWALLRLLVERTGSRGEGGDGGNSHLLQFTVKTIPDPKGGFIDRIGADSGVVRVFVKVTLTGSAEKDKALKLPPFPTVAPVL